MADIQRFTPKQNPAYSPTALFFEENYCKREKIYLTLPLVPLALFAAEFLQK